MNTKVLYVLTTRATMGKCEEDLECHPVTDITEDSIYTNEIKWLRSKLFEVEVIEKENTEIIVRVPFLIKEAALVWVRECFIYIKQNAQINGIREAVDEEWHRILLPTYDSKWFTGGKKVEEWRAQMRQLADSL